MKRTEQYLNFIMEAEALKSTLRTAWTAEGRRESTAEHSWRLALLAGLFAADETRLDLGKVLFMSLVHDLGEIYDGDISAAELPDEAAKHEEEYRAVQKITGLLPEDQANRLRALWEEYNENATPEARLVKALDKAETIIQHAQGKNPQDFDYEFNLKYGAGYFQEQDCLKELRELIDAGTRRRMNGE